MSGSGVRTVRVLQIEDESVDVEMVRRLLSRARQGSPLQFELMSASSLEAGLGGFGTHEVDLVLLDLHLPDGEGPGLVLRLRERLPNVPVIILTGRAEASQNLEFLKLGAQDFLLKHELDPESLSRSILQAIERTRLLAQLEQERSEEESASERWALSRLTDRSGTSVTASLMGLGSLKETLPERYRELLAAYSELLEEAVQSSVFRTDSSIAQRVEELGEELGFLRATPRDLIRIHSDALKGKVGGTAAASAHLYYQEGRYLVLELMGILAYYYRRFYLQWGL